MQNKTNNTKTKATFKDKNQLNGNNHKTGQLSNVSFRFTERFL